jgi:pyridoxine/pyridoxamine 5'-phosphate oxidase
MLHSEFDTVTERPACIFAQPPSNPFSALLQWWSSALARAVAEPGVMALATADSDGFASNRMVQLLDVERRQLVFTTHVDSQKGREIAATAWASGVLYWRETKQQVILSGPVAPLGTADCDERWFKRPRETNAMSSVSHQSAMLEDEEGLRKRARELAQSNAPLARPPGWLAYGLMPRLMEFWEFSADRLHRRLRYEAQLDVWTHCRLQP